MDFNVLVRNGDDHSKYFADEVRVHPKLRDEIDKTLLNLR